MKKAIVAICALALLAGAVSCKKDKDQPNNSEVVQDPTEEPVAYVEGFYNPARHIATLREGDNRQEWSWDASTPKRLNSITDNTDGASYTFTYKSSGRVATATRTMGGKSVVYAYNYDEETLDRYTVKENGVLQADATVTHNANGKISNISYSGLKAGFVLDMLGYPISSDDITLTNGTYDVNYSWTGNNATTVAEEGTFAGQVSMKLLMDLFGDQIASSLGDYASLLMLALQEMEGDMLDYTITLSRSTDYTYDDKNNPLRGFWGEGLALKDAVLSANNIKTATAVGNANIATIIKLNLPATCPDWVPEQYQSYWFIIQPMINGQEYPVNRDIPLNAEASMGYEYNDAGFPTAITNGENRAEISYCD